eukprot:CAMPEP_0119477530 /NCGR_PEP_ID=MMETSP1344-20130328/7629_1 /TAXON_ID=236787 /ORGANISM="Florenciella parvula, Strain CCMP2471" /LENGTH=521 /DNA_ID=CAMNT_0007511539 /DNA_START=187 /DNA_END=1752 /DNA_ORIENTATION=-
MSSNPFARPGDDFRVAAERRAAAARQDKKPKPMPVEPAPTPSPVKSPPPRGETPSWAQPQATSTALQSATAGYSQQPGEYPQQLQPPHPPPSAFGAAPSGGTPSFQQPPPSAFAQPPAGPFGQPQLAQAPPQNYGGGGGGGGGSAPGAFGGPLVGAPGGPRLPPGQAIATPVPLGPNAPKWVEDGDSERCTACMLKFDWKRRRHHCRGCGRLFCDECSAQKLMLPASWGKKDPARVCNACAIELGPQQQALISTNTNALRENRIQQDGARRYMNRPLNFTLGGEVRKASHTILNLMSGVEAVVEDHSIVEDLLRNAQGLLFITVAKMAFIGGIRVGTGLLVTRANTSRGWSAPCAVGSWGLSFGAEVGLETSDMIIPICSAKSLSHFTRGGGHMMMGGEAGLALGPVGRTITREVSASGAGTSSTKGYSHSKGIYGGIALQGAYVKVRKDVNQKFYGYDITPAQLLSGHTPVPPAAKSLYDALDEYSAWVTGINVMRRASEAAGPAAPTSSTTGGAADAAV